MPTISATAFPDEAYVLVEADWSGAIFRDTFQRISASNWTPADTGQAYTIQIGAAGDYTINGTKGVVTHAAVASDLRITAGISLSDVRFTGYVTSTTVPAGGNFAINIMARFVDNANFVFGTFFLTPTGVSLIAGQRVGGVVTNTAFFPVAVGNTGVYGFTLEASGSTVRFRVWDAASAEPQTWAATFTTTLLTAGAVGVWTGIPGGVTSPLPILFLYDDLVAYDLSLATSDCAIVTRRNTVTGEVVQLRPYISYDPDGAMLLECGLGLWWDTEPPLNVELEYCTFACDALSVVSVNPDFEANVAGWTAIDSTVSLDCSVAKVGACSASILPSATLTIPGMSQSGITLAAGRLATISAWARSPQGWNGVFLELVVTYSDLTSQTLRTLIVTLDDNEWRYLAASFVPRLTVTDATLYFLATGFPPNTVTFNVDQIGVSQLTDVTASACDTVTVESDSVWLKHPLQPCLDVEIGLCSPMLDDCEETARVSYVGTFEDTFHPNTVVLGPANRRRPIPINRVRRDAEATLRLLTHDCDATEAVLAINESGDPLLFQAPAQYCIPDRYISVGSLSETRFSVDQREEFRLMTLPYWTVDRPEGSADGPCGTRIEDLCDIYTSWAALSMAGLSWTDLMLGEASTNGPGQPDPPAAARDWDEVESEFADWDDVEAGGTRDWDELRDGA